MWLASCDYHHVTCIMWLASCDYHHVTTVMWLPSCDYSMVAGVFPTTIGCWVCDRVRCERVQICHCERVWTHGTKVLSLHKSASGNSFLIVHPQVPQFRPEQAFAMFERFIKDQPFWCCVPCAYFWVSCDLEYTEISEILIWIIHESYIYDPVFLYMKIHHDIGIMNA